MANITNLTIKKNDGTTDITWTGEVGSAGDKIPARYSSRTVSTIPAFQPKFSVAASGTPDGKVRRMDLNALYQHTATNSTTGLTSEVSRCTFRGTWSVPQDIPSATVDEFVSQLANLIKHPDVVAQIKAQQAAS